MRESKISGTALPQSCEMQMQKHKENHQVITLNPTALFVLRWLSCHPLSGFADSLQSNWSERVPQTAVVLLDTVGYIDRCELKIH